MPDKKRTGTRQGREWQGGGGAWRTGMANLAGQAKVMAQPKQTMTMSYASALPWLPNRQGQSQNRINFVRLGGRGGGLRVR